MTRWWMRNFIPLEGFMVVLATAGFAFWVFFLGGADYFVLKQTDYNFSFFTALIGIFGTFLGFMIAVITFLFGLVDKRWFSTLRASHSYPQHWAIFKGALNALAFGTLISVIGLVCLWIKNMPLTVLVAILGAAVWSTARMYRVIWVIAKMIDAEVRSGQASRDEFT